MIRSMSWGVFVQRQACPELVVIKRRSLRRRGGDELVEHDEMVETLRPD
jgi:hypothetical protein